MHEQLANLDRVAKEAALVELYRQDKLSHHQLAQALGLSRLETDALLKKHGVTEDLPGVRQFQRQADELRRELKR